MGVVEEATADFELSMMGFALPAALKRPASPKW